MQKGSNILRKVQLTMSKYRHEYKYIVDEKQYAVLELKASVLMKKDLHALRSGKYQITSLYFDDYQNSCFYENENGTDPRSKFRIRYYNNDTKYIKLEKKSKSHGMTQKESCAITEEQCMMLMNGMIPGVTGDMSEKQANLFSEMRLRNMLPKVIVSYERIPYVYQAGNVRITFDRNLTSSCDINAFLDGTFGKRPIMESGMSVLEVKWDELMPSHIRENMQIDNLQWTAFSKYYLCRKYNLNGGLK